MPERKQNKSHKPGDRDGGELALPRGGLASIFDEFMRPFFDFEAFFPTSMRSIWTDLSTRQPVVELQDRGDHYTLTAELPGFSKDQVDVRINPNSVEVKAEKSEKESKDGTELRRSFSSFHRYFSLPERVVSDKVDGTMKNGILELKLPKQEPKLAEKTRRLELK